MKIDKRTALTAISAICGAGGFIANLMSKDENEEIAKRAAEILEEKQNSSEE